ncbi:FAD-dependent oxidoreductase [Streptomyces sp. NPDC007162]|uniref:FAD-dependent oxidoreductase n=1 Tax=Streptomyces sp. NPDC007162 TaxID=3156917 RepID=UPI0033FBFE15
MTRILIIGGGIAGTASALALHKAGFDVEVYEAHPDTAEDIGAFLTLGSNGMRALAQIDATAEVTALGFPLTSIRLLDDRGSQTAHRLMGDAHDPLLNFRCLRRGELNAALQAKVARRGIAVRHSARLARLDDHHDGVTAHFTDGSTATGDLLLGADGLNSTVRRAIAPFTQPRYAGQRVFYGYTTDIPPVGESDCFTMIRGSEAAFGFASSPDGETYWFARVAGDPLSAEEIAEGSPADWRTLLVPLLRKDTTPAADVVSATAEHLTVTNATELPLGIPWRSGRALILGDAAHAASPAAGQGASMALEDAVVLAKCLRDLPDTDSALTRYESLRRERVEHNITTSGAMSRGTYAPSGSGGRSTPTARSSAAALIEVLDWESDISDLKEW